MPKNIKNVKNKKFEKFEKKLKTKTYLVKFQLYCKRLDVQCTIVNTYVAPALWSHRIKLKTNNFDKKFENKFKKFRKKI